MPCGHNGVEYHAAEVETVENSKTPEIHDHFRLHNRGRELILQLLLACTSWAIAPSAQLAVCPSGTAFGRPVRQTNTLTDLKCCIISLLGITEWSTTHQKSKPLKIQKPRNSPTFPVTQPEPDVEYDRKLHQSTRLAKPHNNAEHSFSLQSLPGKISDPKPIFIQKSSLIRRIFQPTPKVVARNVL
jgi:hypothetical protein